MAVTRTARVPRTLSFGVTTSGDVKLHSVEVDPHLPKEQYWANVRHEITTFFGVIIAEGVTRDAFGNVISLAEGRNPGDEADIAVRVTYSGIFGSWTAYSAWTPIPPDTTVYAINLNTSGTISISAVAEEWISDELMDPLLRNPDGFRQELPDQLPYPDGLKAYRANLMEKTKPGGAWALSISIGGATISQSGTFSGSTPLTYDVSVTTFGRGYTGLAFSVAGSTQINWIDAPAPSASRTRSDAAGSGSATISGTTSSITIDLESGSDADNWIARCDWSTHPIIRYALDARLRAMAIAYPGSLTMRLVEKYLTEVDVTLGPTATRAIAQTRYDGSVSLGPESDGDTWAATSANEIGPVRGWLKSPGLAAAGEDVRDWTLMALGHRYKVADMIHAASYVVNACTSLTGWSAGSNTTLSLFGGFVRATVAGGTGSFSLAASKRIEAYRYLTIDAQADASRTVTVRIGTKTWTLNLTSSLATYTIDLCNPHNGVSPLVDGQQTRWPHDANAYPATEGPLWGVSNLATFEIIDIPNGSVIDLQGIDTVRSATATWSPMAPFFEWLQEDNLGATIQRIQALYVDGRMVHEPPHNRKAAGGAYSHRVIQSVFNILQVLLGLTLTPASAFADSLHNLNGYAYWLHCGQHDGSGWLSDYSQDITSSRAIYAQARWHEIQGYPGVGDAWSNAAFVAVGHPDYATLSALPFRIEKHLRGSGGGIAFSTSSPLNGATIEARETDSGTLVGTDTTDSIGTYETGTPHGKGNEQIETKLLSGVQPAYTRLWGNRLQARASFRVGGGGEVHQDKDPASGYNFAVFVAGGALKVLRYHPEHGQDAIFTIVSSGVTRAQVMVRPNGSIGVVYESGGNVYIRSSYSLGESWSMPTTIASGRTHPAPAADEEANWEYVAGHNGTKFQLYRSKQQGAWELVGDIVTVAAGQAGLLVCGDSSHRLSFIYYDGADLKRLSSTNGGTSWS